MDIYEPIRDFLLFMSSEPEQTESLESKCGIISSCYPPTDLHPDGVRVEYAFPIKPKDINFFTNVRSE